LRAHPAEHGCTSINRLHIQTSGLTPLSGVWARRLNPESEDFAPEWEETFESFDAMGLHENLLRGIYAYGFEKPSAIQQRGIVPFTKGLDVIQQAQSGTGKTATFCAGILHQLDYSVQECQALVLAPTRELAQQIEKVMRALGDYLQVKCHACVGGTSVREDQRTLQVRLLPPLVLCSWNRSMWCGGACMGRARPQLFTSGV